MLVKIRWCPIRMPRNYVAYQQAHENNAFVRLDDGAYVVSAPFDIDSRPLAATKPYAKFADKK